MPIEECPGVGPMGVRQIIATSEGGGCPCRQSRPYMTSALKNTLHNTLNKISTHSC
jgi:hypothetical protein